MNTVLALFIPLVVAVSGDGDVTNVTGCLKGSVLLPCNCSQRSGRFVWQMDDPTAKLVFEHNDTCSYSDSYKGRSQVFNNCSLFLTNLTNNDAGQYRCIFTVDTMRKRWLVNVIVSDGQSNKSSNLATHRPEPKCDIKNENVPINTTWTCNESKGNSSDNSALSPLSQSRTHFACIPLMAAGLFMSLGASWNCHETGVEAEAWRIQNCVNVDSNQIKLFILSLFIVLAWCSFCKWLLLWYIMELTMVRGKHNNSEFIQSIITDWCYVWEKGSVFTNTHIIKAIYSGTKHMLKCEQRLEKNLLQRTLRKQFW